MNRNELLLRSRQAVKQAHDSPHKLLLVHTAVAVGATLLVALISYLLNVQMAAHTGLSGMSTRSALQTAQMLMSYVLMVLMPLWEAGVLFVAVRIFRGESVGLPSLTEGLRRFGPLLRTMLLELGVYAAAILGCSYGISMLYSLTPFAMQAMENLEPWMQNITTQEQLLTLMRDSEFIEALLQNMWPAVLLSAIAAVGAMVFLFYVTRFMRYLVLDGNIGVFRALKTSISMTAGHKMDLVKLDLHFWWYYVLQVAVTLILYIPELCALAGVSLPMDGAVAYWLFYGLYAVAQIALLTLARPMVEVTFAGAYDWLKPKE